MDNTKIEQVTYLIRELQKEIPEYSELSVPKDPDEAFKLFRALCNVRMPRKVSDKFLAVQDAYLRTLTSEKGITDSADLQPSTVDSRLYVWQGDITTLRCDAIVNAANSQMLGCFRPLHNCIDNMIHTMAGVELRIECDRQMDALRKKYGKDYEQPVSVPMVTPGYNLPAKYVIHVVGPIVMGSLQESHKQKLADCYTHCLEAADAHGCESIAFCCISTGVFMFSADAAAGIAVKTVKEYLNAHPDSKIKRVVFNVFKDRDFALYKNLLGEKNS
ncbi:MAG: protein-ADP-ribose hydrolase [Acidaminococcus sp.]|jgi:O-acetyl-ADP-ribose deacetylase (regulator of RNase III)|nr:protein-ADP-ribose hydrolase [Acidaminococcus sp.]MCI2099767.1 protein-ADP-ribose hydrolase [Acidaminococcus sp.]MCI2113963.1 protein-ADP-ribose hydrolase [Acidaminococcus sp.]MCI2117080.1 protein-ADP-ribose hydrolase [Acidaminococcus sp.]